MTDLRYGPRVADRPSAHAGNTVPRRADRGPARGRDRWGGVARSGPGAREDDPTAPEGERRGAVGSDPGDAPSVGGGVDDLAAGHGPQRPPDGARDRRLDGL